MSRSKTLYQLQQYDSGIDQAIKRIQAIESILNDSNELDFALKKQEEHKLNFDEKQKYLKSDVAIAKNYLNEAHIKKLNRIISAYLDLAENRAQRQIIMKMQDWAQFLHSFLELSNYPILQDKGKVSALKAKLKAEQEYEEYRVIQDENYMSDFDKEVWRIKEGKDNYK